MKDALCPYFMQIYVETPIFVHAATVVCTMAFLGKDQKQQHFSV